MQNFSSTIVTFDPSSVFTDSYTSVVKYLITITFCIVLIYLL